MRPSLSLAIDSPAPRSRLAMRRAQLAEESGDQPRTTLWTPIAVDGAAVTTDAIRSRTRPPEPLPATIEAALLHTLTRPLGPGESHHEGNAARERELGALLMSLDGVQCHHLRRRLDLDANTDAIAVAFRRLLGERRQRLRSILTRPRATASAPRR